MKIQYSSESLMIYESHLYRTTTTLLIGENHLMVVDPNWSPDEVNFIYVEIKRLGKAKKDWYLFYTHSDYDHIIANGLIAEKCQTIGSVWLRDNPNRLQILNEIRESDQSYGFERHYPITYPKLDWEMMEEQSDLKIDDTEYEFIDGRGHNTDGMLCLVKKRKLLIVGDYLSNIEFPYVYHNVKAYLAVLDRIENLVTEGRVTGMICGHGDHTFDTKEIINRIQISRSYIQDVRDFVEKGSPIDIEQYLNLYPADPMLLQEHQKNIALFRAESLTK